MQRLQKEKKTFDDTPVTSLITINAITEEESLDMSKEDIARIRDWLKDEKIPGARTDDKFIRIFLRGCKNNAEVAKKKLFNYYQMRKTMTDWFEVRDPKDMSILHLLQLGVMFPMPKKDSQGRTVIIVKAGANNPKTNPMSDVFKLGMMIVDLAMEEDEAVSRNGITLIIDLDGVGLGHALQMTPGLVRRAVHSWQDCYPIRIHGIDFINCPPHVNIILNIFRRFLREKLRKRLRTHGKVHLKLREYINPKCLPEEYGGSYGPVAPVIQCWANKVLSRRDWFLDNQATNHLT